MSLETIGEDTTNTQGTLITASGSVDTYGSYSELVASTGIASKRITIQCLQGLAGASASQIVALATGAASSEVDFVEFMIPKMGIAFGVMMTVELPFTIAASTRISARTKAALGNHTVRLLATLNTEDAYGTSTENETIGISNSEGTAIDPGGSADTKGSYVELTASTGMDYDLIIVQMGHNNNTVASAANWLVDIATGAAASEVVAIPDIYHGVSIFECPPSCHAFYHTIASGTRIAVRAQCDITDATDRIFDIVLIGVNITAPAGGGAATTASGFMA